MSTPIVAVLVLLAIAAVVVLWKVVATAAVIGGVQWLIVEHVTDVAVQVIAFAAPAFLAAFVLTRLFAPRPADSHSTHHGRLLKGAVR
jgi:membrane protein implicated in regulation of membrane protease activity